MIFLHYFREMKGTNRICTPHDIETSKQTDKRSNAGRLPSLAIVPVTIIVPATKSHYQANLPVNTTLENINYC